MDLIWACEQSALAHYLADHDAAIAVILENPLFLADKPKASRDDDEDPDDLDDILDIDGQGVAHIQVSGVLTQDGPSWLDKLFGAAGTSYKAIHQALADADANPAVVQKVLHINSPGGSVDGGLDACWQAIQTSGKPSAVMVDGMMASAAYWIGSAVGPGNIYSSSPANMIGSIGVRAAILDRTDQQKQSGVKKYDFVSKNAPNKLQDPKTDAGKAAIQAEIDAVERVFHSRVAAGRGVSADYVAEKFGQGGCYVAQDPKSDMPCALSVGMIDAISASVPLPKSVPAYMRNTLAAAPVAAISPVVKVPAVAADKEKSMNLDEYLKENPDAAARVQTMLASARAEGETAYKTRAAKVGLVLTSDAYKGKAALQSRGLACLKGEISLEAFDNLVAMVDMDLETEKLAAAAAQVGPDGKPLADTAPASVATAADLLVKAAALKIDVAAVQASAKQRGIDPQAALKGEIELQEMIAHDKAMGA